MLRFLLYSLFLFGSGSALLAEDCSRVAASCEASNSLMIGGVRLEASCTELRVEQRCVDPNPVDECVPFRSAQVLHNDVLADGQCRELSRSCTQYSSGKCLRHLVKYECWNGPLSHAPADLENRVFHNYFEHTPDTCSAQELNPRCSWVNDAVTDGYETRVINGLDVTRSWWAIDRHYDCTDPSFEDTCEIFRDDPVCTKVGEEVCLDVTSDGVCRYAEHSYDCDVEATFQASCEAIDVCVGDNCVGVEQDPSEDFARAASWLNVLDSMADDFGCNRDGAVVDPITGLISLDACPTDPLSMAEFLPRLFSGRSMSCNRGSTNCCDFDGEGICSAESDELAEHRLAGVTQYIGSQCTSSFLGVCLSVREYYCVYKTKFARVFQQQADLQTGNQFPGWQTSDPCPSLDIYQLEALDVDVMDFSEVFESVFDKMSVPVQGEVMDRLTDGVTDFAPEVHDVFE